MPRLSESEVFRELRQRLLRCHRVDLCQQRCREEAETGEGSFCRVHQRVTKCEVQEKLRLSIFSLWEAIETMLCNHSFSNLSCFSTRIPGFRPFHAILNVSKNVIRWNGPLTLDANSTSACYQVPRWAVVMSLTSSFCKMIPSHSFYPIQFCFGGE